MQQGPDLFMAESFDFGQHEHGAVTFRQRLDGLLQIIRIQGMAPVKHLLTVAVAQFLEGGWPVFRLANGRAYHDGLYPGAEGAFALEIPDVVKDQ